MTSETAGCASEPPGENQRPGRAILMCLSPTGVWIKLKFKRVLAGHRNAVFLELSELFTKQRRN